MPSLALKDSCDKPKRPKLKDFFNQIDACHDEIEKDIEEMKATLNGDEKWMRKEPKEKK